MEVEVQFHHWPWSTGVRERTTDLTTGESARVPFWGSPVVSLSDRAELLLPRRHERFAPFGPPFQTLGGKYQLYEVPHGVLASTEGGKGANDGVLQIKLDDRRVSVRLLPSGAGTPASHAAGEEGEQESDLKRTVLAWSQFFDDLIEEAHLLGDAEGRFPWKKIYPFIEKLGQDSDEPRMALIVKIAERMHRKLPITVNAARKVLLRERKMLAASRVSETDAACLRWFVRQPGEMAAEKAALNRQALLGVARKESFETLENRVLLSFINRCILESGRYLVNEVGHTARFQNSQRTGAVRSFRALCNSLRRQPLFEGLSPPPPQPSPNYVLQNDYRYREVWRYYRRLLRREEEEDRLWDWQARTWADVARLLVNTALCRLGQDEAGNCQFVLEEMLDSFLRPRREQCLGSRLEPGSEPGPFLIWKRGGARADGSVIEVVHSDLAGQHDVTKDLGRTGGHMYLVVTPLNGGRRSVIVLWAVHAAATTLDVPWKDLGRLAGKALLETHAVLLGDRKSDFPVLQGLVVGSDLKSRDVEIYPGSSDSFHAVQVSTDQRCWHDAIAGIRIALEDIFEGVV